MDFNKYTEPLGGNKKFIILCIVVGSVFVTMGGCTGIVRLGSKKNDKKIDKAEETQAVEEMQTVSESESEITTTVSETNVTETTEETVLTEESDNGADSDAVEQTQIELIAGELGEYGQIITLNEGSDLADTNYCYFVPSGTYQVTNMGEHPTQVDVYKNERSTDTDADGNEYEYWADGTAYLIDVGTTKEVVVDEGYFIEIEEPTHIVLLTEN